MISSDHLRELNRLLIIADDLQHTSSTPYKSAVLLACSESTFRGSFHEHEETLDCALSLGLLVLGKEGEIRITGPGTQFISLNPEHYYELQPAQRSYLFRVAVADGPLRAPAAKLASSLERDRANAGMAFKADVLATATAEVSACFNVLHLLRVVREQNGIWTVSPEFLALFARLRRHRTMGEAEFQAVLEEQARFGRAAEVLAVEYERSRLRSLGADAEALLVSRISETDIAAGFDVESFDGASSSLKPDRFIEVKASSSETLRFFWTRNEQKIAATLGRSYHIYYLGAFKPERGLEGFCPRIIVDPVATLPSLPDVRVEPYTYLVNEDSAVGGEVSVTATPLSPADW